MFDIANTEKPRTCMFCRGDGQPGGCIVCGKDSEAAVVKTVITQEVLQSYAVPQAYKGRVFDKEVLIATHNEFKDDRNFHRFIESLSKLYERFRSGILPIGSVLICADRGFGKRTLIYSCMQEALSHGFTTTNVIDNSQYRKLLLYGTEKPKGEFIRASAINLEDIHNCDILFVTVDNLNYMTSLRVIENLCEKRSRTGKPTIITSRYSPAIMCKMDDYTKPEGMFNIGGDHDKFKHPSLIQFYSGGR